MKKRCQRILSETDSGSNSKSEEDESIDSEAEIDISLAWNSIDNHLKEFQVGMALIQECSENMIDPVSNFLH